MQASDLFGNRDAKKAVLEFVESALRPGDEASVMTFGSLTGLVLRQYLTLDREKIRKAIRRSIEMGGGAVASGSGDVTAVSGGGGEVAADDEEEIAAGREAQRVLTEGGGEERAAGARPVMIKGRVADDSPFGIKTGIRIEAPGGPPPGAARSKSDFDTDMADLARAMKYISGSKSVVYFSTRTPGKDVARLFAEANATIYAVNTNSVPAKGGGAGASRRREMKERQGVALKDFAEASGGHYFAEAKEAATIARDVETLSGNYYVLGYYITPAWDGREHKIKVEVKAPEVRVLVQDAFNDPKPFAQMSDLEKKLQLFDVALSDKPVATDILDLPLQVLAGTTMAEANTAVVIELAVDEKTSVPAGKTEIFTFIFDKDHKIVVGERGEINTVPHARKVLFPYLLTKLRPGEYECRVVARNTETGQTAASRRPFTIASPAASGMSLASPLLFIPGRKAEFVRMARPDKKEKNQATIIRFFPFLPKDSAPLLGDLPPDVRTIRALVPLQAGNEPPAETLLDVKLVRLDDKEEIPVDWTLLDARRAEAGTEFLLLEISVAGLGPGAYRLEFSVSDVVSGASASATSPLVRK
jgi:VWFA-related protein